MKRFFTLIFLCFFMQFSAFGAMNIHWQTVAPGIEYAFVKNPDKNTFGYVHIFKINLQKNTLNLAFAKDDWFPAETVGRLAEKNRALLAVNGGFFTSEWHPIGLRIQNSQVRSPLHTTPWWHVFYLKNNEPHMVSENEYHLDAQITLAIQSGPRLLMNGQMMPLKPDKAERTAIGITKKGEIIILATEHWPLATPDLARFFKEKLDCTDALNLDGGSSTQLYAHMGDFKLTVESLALITDILYVRSKK